MNMYWEGNGKHQDLYRKLLDMVDSEKPDPKMKGFLRANVVYYDLFNNGLVNRAAEFRRLFGFGGTEIARKGYPEDLVAKVEEKMDAIILKTAAAMGL